MVKKKKSKSVTERILELKNFMKTPKSAEEIKAEIKESTGYSIDLEDIRVNLLYLLRREKIKRKKEEKIYKYCIE